MAIFNNMAITNKGQALYAKAQAGLELHFTKIMVGSGQLETRNPMTLTELIEPKFDIGIQSITPNTELKTATISGTINNSEVTEAVYICEIGLFADDPDEGEILYAYGSAGTYGDYYAPATQGAYSWNYQINAAIGNAANVTVELSNLAYDYGVISTNSTLVKITGGNQKEINKSIDSALQNLSNNKADKKELQTVSEKVDNIDLSASKVNLSAISGMSSKNVQDGIAELFQSASNGKSAVAGVVGNVTGSSTFAEIKNRIQTDKNTLASNISNKGVSASGSETVASLASKVSNITIGGMGGKKFATGTITLSIVDWNVGKDSHTVETDLSFLSFVPSFIEIYVEKLEVHWSSEILTSVSNKWNIYNIQHKFMSYFTCDDSTGKGYVDYSINRNINIELKHVPVFEYIRYSSPLYIKNALVTFKAWE